eukprot:scaffold118_cov382-Prasinococcus_capsulatus_cf.AAC.9
MCAQSPAVSESDTVARAPPSRRTAGQWTRAVLLRRDMYDRRHPSARRHGASAVVEGGKGRERGGQEIRGNAVQGTNAAAGDRWAAAACEASGLGGRPSAGWREGRARATTARALGW